MFYAFDNVVLVQNLQHATSSTTTAVIFWWSWLENVLWDLVKYVSNDDVSTTNDNDDPCDDMTHVYIEFQARLKL